MFNNIKIATLLSTLSLTLLAGCGGENDSTSSTQSDGTTPSFTPVAEANFAQNMLAAINQYRASEQQCGTTKMPAVAPLSWSQPLETAAQVHSSNMANYDFFDHDGLDNKTDSDRAKDAGYPEGIIGENIAGGQKTLAKVLDTWMSSEDHCKNIMSSTYTDVGAAVVENPDAKYRYYWTQVFGTPR